MRQMLANRRVVDTDKPDHGIPAGSVLLMAGDFGNTIAMAPFPNAYGGVDGVPRRSRVS